MVSSSRIYVTVLTFCLLTFLLTALLAGLIFEHVPHSEDEVAYLFQAKIFAQNRLTVPTPANAAAFWSPFVIDYAGQRFGKYPPGWPLLLSLGVRLGAPWLVNAGLAALTVALFFRLGLYLYNATTGLWAAGLALLTPGFLFLSSSLLSHSASLFWVTLALFWLVTFHVSRFTFYALLTGLALGLAGLTRPFAALGVGLPLGFFALVLAVRGEFPRRGLFWIGLGSAVILALLPLYGWAIGGDPTFNPYLLVWPYDRTGFGPEIGPHGYTLSDALLINTRLKLLALATGLFGWPGWSNLLFLPIPFLARRANRWDWLLLGILASLVFVHIFYWAFGGVDGGFPRYYYDALPALLLLTARGIQMASELLEYAGDNLAYINRLRRLPLVLILLFTLYSLIWRWPALLSAQKGKYGISPAPLQVVQQANLPLPALILVQDVASWRDFAAPFAANSPSLDGSVVYAIDWNPGYTQRVRTQFAGRSCWELRGSKLYPCPPRE